MAKTPTRHVVPALDFIYDLGLKKHKNKHEKGIFMKSPLKTNGS
jgi:hypothetical protein